VSVIAFDYDNFKQVNDQYGHAAGDHILRASSALIASEFVRAVDLFGRMGGEEFVVVLQGIGREDAVVIAETMRRRLEEEPFNYDGETIRLTASFGVSSATSSTDKPEFLLLRADELLYRSKREGRNRVSA
jgi:diguanylate cyclase (GGDEF)-like protein